MKLTVAGALLSITIPIGLASSVESVESQVVSATPYVSVGVGSDGNSTAAGIRLEVMKAWGAYARTAVRAATNGCEVREGPACNLPQGNAVEYVGGVVHRIGTSAWRGYIAVGAGVLGWEQEQHTLVDLSVEARRQVLQRVSLLIGVRTVAALNVEQEPNGGEPTVAKKNVVFTDLMIGLAVALF